MANKSLQIAEGTVVGNWKVVSEQPKRNTKGVLEWEIECSEGHHTTATHAALSYSIAPSICTACVQVEREQHAAMKADERRLERELAALLLDQRRQEKEAQAVQIAEPGKLGQTRVLIVPAPEVKESEASNV